MFAFKRSIIHKILNLIAHLVYTYKIVLGDKRSGKETRL